MTDRLDQAAKLFAMAAISKARRTSRVGARIRLHIPSPSKETMSSTSSDQALRLAAVLFRQFALDEEGQPLPTDTLEQSEAAETAPTEWVKVGTLRLLITDPDPTALALATGAIEAGGPPVLCVRVRLDVAPDQPQPCMGDLIAIDGGEPGAALVFQVQWTNSDACAPIPVESLDGLQPQDVERDDALALGPDEALLVQIVDTDGLDAP